MAVNPDLTQAELFNYIQGSEVTGQSAYDIWKSLGNTGTEEDFLEFIRTGTKGDTGLSAYEEWVNKTTSADKSYAAFLSITKGDKGADGKDGADWNGSPVDYVLMRDVSNGNIYKVSVSNGTVKATAE